MSESITHFLTGHGVWLPLFAFLLAAVAVFGIASRLARHADAISDATGLGRAWIGTVLLAASTSVPELTTDVNASLLGTIDIGVGDLVGSTLANMLLLAVLDLAFFRRRILDHVSPEHALVGTIAVVLTAIAGAAIANGGLGRVGPLGIETLLIFGIYLLGMRAVYGNIQPTAPPEQLELGETSRTLLREALIGFALAAVGLLIMAPLVVLCAEAISVEGGLTESFVGTLLVGFTTSLPEMAATFAAVRLGAFDLAVGNLLGSCAFNMCILLAMDIAYRNGPVLAHASQDHVLSALLAVVCVALGMLGILARRGQRLGPVRIESVLIVLTYVGALLILSTGKHS